MVNHRKRFRLSRQEHFHKINSKTYHYKTENRFDKSHITIFEQRGNGVLHTEKKGVKGDKDQTDKHDNNSRIDQIFKGPILRLFIAFLFTFHFVSSPAPGNDMIY